MSLCEGAAMTLIPRSDRQSVEALSNLHYCNPFLEERINEERKALGDDFHEGTEVRVELHYDTDINLTKIGQRIEQFTERLRQRLVEGVQADDRELEIYEDLVLYWLYRRYRIDLERAIANSTKEATKI